MIGIAVGVQSPLDIADGPYVELRVPEEWEKQKTFIEKLRRVKPPGFEHVSEHPAIEQLAFQGLCDRRFSGSG